MHSKSIAALSATLAGILVGCSSEPTAAPPPISMFEGVTLPGHMADAKAAGFTNCTADYVCRKAGAVTVLGVQAQEASVRLEQRVFKGGDYFGQEVPAEKRSLGTLAYAEVTYSFAPERHEEECVAAQLRNGSYDERPCLITKDGAGALVAALEANGWVRLDAKQGDRFYKEGQPVELKLAWPKDGAQELYVRADTLENVSSVLAHERERLQAAAAQKAQQNAFVSAMKE